MKEQRTIIIAAQNETVRKYKDQPLHDLATLAMGACTTILITSKAGHQSLTHADFYTDLAFIDKEVAWTGAKEGEFTIDVIVNPTSPTSNGERAKSYIDQKWPGVKNSKDTTDLRKCPEGTVLVRQDNNQTKLFMPKFDHFMELFPGRSLSANNSLKGSHLHSPSEGADMRSIVRQLYSAFSSQPTELPLVAYDEGQWVKAFPPLPKDIALKLQGWRKQYQEEGYQFSMKLMFEVMSNSPYAKQALELRAEATVAHQMQNLPPLLGIYWKNLEAREQAVKQ